MRTVTITNYSEDARSHVADPRAELRTYREQAVKASKELGYDFSVTSRVRQAASCSEIARIMFDARNEEE